MTTSRFDALKTVLSTLRVYARTPRELQTIASNPKRRAAGRARVLETTRLLIPV